MVGTNTRRIVAAVEDVKPWRDFTMGHFPSDSMSNFHNYFFWGKAKSKSTVTIAPFTALPYPAGFCLENHSPESDSIG